MHSTIKSGCQNADDYKQHTLTHARTHPHIQYLANVDLTLTVSDDGRWCLLKQHFLARQSLRCSSTLHANQLSLTGDVSDGEWITGDVSDVFHSYMYVYIIICVYPVQAYYIVENGPGHNTNSKIMQKP